MRARAIRLGPKVRRAIAFEHPETIVMRLLQDALGATRRALHMAHASAAHGSGEMAVLDHPQRLAVILEPHLIELDKLIDAYQHALQHQAAMRHLSQMDLPF